MLYLLRILFLLNYKSLSKVGAGYPRPRENREMTQKIPSGKTGNLKIMPKQ